MKNVRENNCETCVSIIQILRKLICHLYALSKKLKSQFNKQNKMFLEDEHYIIIIATC
jgi:hypothetical protein